MIPFVLILTWVVIAITWHDNYFPYFAAILTVGIAALLWVRSNLYRRRVVTRMQRYGS